MKIIYQIMLITIGIVGKIEAQNPINMSFLNSQNLQITNSDSKFTYHVFISRKGKQVEDFLVAPNSQKIFVYKFKRKKVAKKMSINYKYDEQARNADKNAQLARSSEFQYAADNIENECWTKVRQLGWLLATEGLILGEGRMIEAIYRIIANQGKDVEDIKAQIRILESQLEDQYLSNKKRIWKTSVVAYLKQLLDAIENPFERCPELEYRQKQYLSTAQTLREGVIVFDNKLEKERYQTTNKNIWKNASNKNNLIPSFVGFGLEVNKQVTTHTLVMADANTKTTVGIVSPENSSQWNTEIKAILPISKQFNGLLWKFPARMFTTANVGQGSATFMSNDPNIYLGVKDKDDANPSFALNNEGRLKLNYNYAALGLRYMFMPDDRMWLSWEVGVSTIKETNLNITAKETFNVKNNAMVTGTKPEIANVRVLNKMPVNNYLKIQYSIALFPVSKRSLYPNRKKIVIGFNVGSSGFNNSKQASANELVQINTNQKKITEINPLKAFKTSLNVGYGVYLYL